MPELTTTRQKIVSAVLGRNPEYVRIIDRQGKPLTFILAEEIRPEGRPGNPSSEEGKKPPAS